MQLPETVEVGTSENVDGSVAIRRKKGPKYAVEYFRTPLLSVQRETTSLADRFINKDGNDITKAFVNYALPLVGDLPKVTLLSA